MTDKPNVISIEIHDPHRVMKRHPWCNNHNFMIPVDMEDASGCMMCRDLYGSYPLKVGDSPDELRKRHFPNVKVVCE